MRSGGGFFDNARPPVCREADCDRPVKTKGLCSKHYQRTSNGAPVGRKRKLTPEQVAAVRRRNAAFATKRAIAVEFGVDVQTVRDVLNRTGAYAEGRAS